MEMNGQLQAQAALPPEKEPRYPLYRGSGGPQSQAGRSGEEKSPIVAPAGNWSRSSSP
jgi:hypothetical protein